MIDLNRELLDAAAAGNVEWIRAAIANGANVSATDDEGNTALHLAARSGCGPACSALLGFAADPQSATNDGRTPLHLAAQAGAERVVELFLDWDADPRAQTTKGDTPLDVALDKGNAAIAKMLLARGAVPSLRNDTVQSTHEGAPAYGKGQAANHFPFLPA